MKTDDDYIVAMTVTDYQEDEIEEESATESDAAELGTIENGAENTTVEETEK
jgi:hypothetical protein